MAKMNWDKARRDERARRAEREDPPKRASTAFHLRGSEVCARCGVTMPRGAPALYDRLDRIVHAHGCPVRSTNESIAARTKARASRGGSSRKVSKAGPSPLKLRRATACTTCGVVMEAGSIAAVNRQGRLVHAGGCPKKNR